MPRAQLQRVGLFARIICSSSQRAKVSKTNVCPRICFRQEPADCSHLGCEGSSWDISGSPLGCHGASLGDPFEAAHPPGRCRWRASGRWPADGIENPSLPCWHPGRLGSPAREAGCHGQAPCEGCFRRGGRGAWPLEMVTSLAHALLCSAGAAPAKHRSRATTPIGSPSESGAHGVYAGPGRGFYAGRSGPQVSGTHRETP